MDKPSDSIALPQDVGRRRFLGTLCIGAVAATAGLPLTFLQADTPSASVVTHTDGSDPRAINHFKAFNAALGVFY